MIKTDKVIYRTRTPEEYDWLMDKLEEAECEWQGGGSPISGKSICDSAKSDSYMQIAKSTKNLKRGWSVRKKAGRLTLSITVTKTMYLNGQGVRDEQN